MIEVSQTLDHMIDIAQLEDDDSLTLDAWKETISKICRIHPKRIYCIKIDPMEKTVSWCPLDLEVTLRDDGTDLDISPSGEDLMAASEIPRGGSLGQSKFVPYGTVIKWDDLDLMQGGLEANQYPGFKISTSKTLQGKALLVKLARHSCEHGSLYIFDQSTEDDFQFVRDEIQWYTKEEAKKRQDDEYEASWRQLQMAQKAGHLGENVRIFRI
jgi:hypothetical protein